MTLRIGLLSASRIAAPAVVAPSREIEGVAVTAVAARDLGRARAAADRYGAAFAYGSYAELVASDEVDAIYVATPAALHRPWSIAAIEAGKHVLCEKPLAANAADAQRIADAAAASDVVVMEAFHWRYHPLVAQMRSILDAGILGELLRVDGRFDLPEGEIPRTDIRWDLSIGGGATMDLGCYPIQWVRFVAGGEPEVLFADAECPVDGVDGALVAEMRWASGLTGSIGSTMIGPPGTHGTSLVVTGSAATMTVDNPMAPQSGSSLVVESPGGRVVHEVATSATYTHQLAAFRDAVVHGATFPTTVDDGVRNMAVIDACYVAAGLEPRPAWPD